MITYDQDPDILRWGLNFLEIGEPFSTNTYCSTSTPQNSGYYNGEYERESHYESVESNVESDEMLAHALQEEYSNLAVAEASGASIAEGEHMQASILAQDWLGPTASNHGSGMRKEYIVQLFAFYICDFVDKSTYLMINTGHEGVPGASDNVDSSSSCYSHGEKQYDGEDWSAFLESDEFSALDGEVGKRLNQMVPIPVSSNFIQTHLFEHISAP